MRILVGVPEKFTADVESSVSISNLLRFGHEVEFCHSDGRGVYGPGPARNRLAQKAIEGEFDRLLMVDSDIVVPQDAIQFLLDPPAPVVLGLYRYKNNTGNIPFFKFEQVDGTDRWNMAEVPEGRFAVKCGGLGCAMLEVGIFRDMPKPWFHWDERPTGKHTGEDIWFCERAKALGIEIVADGRVCCDHIARKVYRWQK